MNERARGIPPGRGGFALLELMIALVLGLVVVLAMGRIILVNQSSWNMGRDKAVLQQNVSESMEWMLRSIREAGSIDLVSNQEFRTYDRQANLLHVYRLDTGAAPPMLLRDGTALIDRRCTQFNVAANSDTTCLTIDLEFADATDTRVAASVRGTLRNATLEF